MSTPVPRKRSSRACDGCKLRRMKCEDIQPSPQSGEPTCKLCRENRVECTFETPVRKRGPAPGFRRSVATPNDSDRGDSERPRVRGSPPDSRDASANDAESSQMAAERAASQQQQQPVRRMQDMSGPANFRSQPLLGLPPVLVDELLAIYFTHVHNIWPLLYKPMFNPRTVSPALLLSMLAVAACVASPPLGLKDGVDADKLYRMAQAELPPDENRMDVVQALILLSLRQTGCGDKRLAFAYAGRASIMCLNLGLHQAPSAAMGPEEAELRSRVYWNTYVLDKILAEETGRPFILPYRTSSTPLPSITESDEFESWPPQPTSSAPLPRSVRGLVPRRGHIISFFTWTTRLSMIIEDIIDLDFTGPPTTTPWDEQFHSRMQSRHDSQRRAEVIQDQLEIWRRSMPSHLEVDLSPNVSPLPHHSLGIAWFHVAEILLYSRFIKRSNGATHEPPLNSLEAQAHSTCSRAAEKCVEIFAHLDSHKLIGCLSADIIHMLGLVTLWEAFDAQDPDETVAHRAKANFAQCCLWLRHCSASWPSASAHKVFFEGLIQGGLKMLAMDQDASPEDPDNPTAASPSIPDGLRTMVRQLASSTAPIITPTFVPQELPSGSTLPVGPNSLFQLPQFYWNQLSTVPFAGSVGLGVPVGSNTPPLDTSGWTRTGEYGSSGHVSTPSTGGPEFDANPSRTDWGALDLTPNYVNAGTPTGPSSVGPASAGPTGTGPGLDWASKSSTPVPGRHPSHLLVSHSGALRNDQHGLMNGSGSMHDNAADQATIYSALMSYMVGAAKGN